MSRMHRARSRRLRATVISIALAVSGCAGIYGFDGLHLVPPVAGRPGLDLTSAGNVSTSPRHRLVGAVGESPGGNVVGRSPRYTLYGGVIAGAR
jgi:hypothetical protein